MTRRTAVYRLYNSEDDLLYVGVSHSPEARWRFHSKDRLWWHEVARRELTWFETRIEAEAAEKRAIQTEEPRYNTCHTPRHSNTSNRKLEGKEEERWRWARSQYAYRPSTRRGRV